MPRFCSIHQAGRSTSLSVISSRRLPVLLALCALLAGISGATPGTAASRLDPRLRSALAQIDELRQARERTALIPQALGPLHSGVGLSASGTELTFDCLIDLAPGQEEATIARLHALGVTTRTRAGEIVTATIPLSALERMESEAGVRFVELSRRLKPSLDVSRGAVRANAANGGLQPPYPQTGFTGKGVLIGVVDTGIDFQNSDFQNDDNTTRLEAYWDQSVDAPSPPAGYAYGVEWSAAELNSGLGSGSIDTDGHGTHVAGIVAGDGSATGNSEPAYQYVGVAPEAPMVVVRTRFGTGDVIDAVNYIFQKAAGRPAVINLSLGTQAGPHDATDSFNRALDNLSGAGKVIVAAAGNEAGLGLHGLLTLPPTGADSVVFTIEVPNYTAKSGRNNDYFALDGWYSNTDNISFVVESPNGRRTQLTGNNSTTAICPTSGSDGRVLVDNNTREPETGDRNIYIEVTDGTDQTTCTPPRVGIWKVIAKRSGPITNGAIHFWLFTDFLGNGSASPKFVAGKDETTLIASPASASRVIGVGATITKVAWQTSGGTFGYSSVTAGQIGQTAPFSSPGPLRDGLLQPDLVAPGMGIASARSGSATYDTRIVMPDGQHVINQGTSQATPQVAGAIALIMQKFGAQTPEQIHARLQGSAVRDAITGSNPNNQYGHGRLDVISALEFGTPIFLSRLEALPDDDGGIRLAWSVEADEPFVGFHVKRGEAAEGPYDRLTATVITGSRNFEYRDRSVTSGRTYWYLLEAVTTSGRIDAFGPLEVRAGAARLELAQNGPNPFGAATTIRFGLPAAGPVTLRIFDVNGRLVRTLLDSPAAAGPGEATWDGRDADGVPQPTGVYFYRLGTRNGSETRKMILKR